MRALLSLIALLGCSHPSLGKASWEIRTPERSFIEPFGRSYSTSTSDGATIGFFRNDFGRASGSGIFCSDIRGGISGLPMFNIELTDRAQATTGTIPVTATPDPSVAGALITAPFAIYDTGSIELTDVDDAIVGTVTASGLTEMGGTATFTGTFEATRCD
ncbi:MAG: hypothetical protein H0T42_18310 [Deltaproteobacteria bacterium]|nr:hypothetical protein [Deltaproteobacteria bacterium]